MVIVVKQFLKKANLIQQSKSNRFRAKLGKKSFVRHQHYIAIHAGVAIASYCNRRADCYNSHKYAVADTLGVAVTTPATFE